MIEETDAPAWDEVAERARAGEALRLLGDFGPGVAWALPGGAPRVALPSGAEHDLGGWLDWWGRAAGAAPALRGADPMPGPAPRAGPPDPLPPAPAVAPGASRLVLGLAPASPPGPAPVLGASSGWAPGTLARVLGPGGEAALIETLRGGGMLRHAPFELPRGGATFPAAVTLAAPPAPWAAPPGPLRAQVLALLAPGDAWAPPRGALPAPPPPPPPPPARATRYEVRLDAGRWRIWDGLAGGFLRGGWPTPERPEELAARLRASDGLRRK